MRSRHDQSFSQPFAAGYQAYIKGDWSQAKEELN